ncbi:SOS response-associated peptidase [Buchananella felis]|uniref:SOS response-associated peptidase n=1 Tax=Buchananella felis TaxID=3231492 RepID=UPI0035292707
MCGRFAMFMTDADFIEEFGVERVADPFLPPSWNVAPTQAVNLVRVAGDGVRELRQARWGLVPSWAKDPAIGARMINARSETAAHKPSFAAALRARRCLVPACGYYEWRAGAAGVAGGRAGAGAAKQPFFISDPSGAPLALAGLYESWRYPAGPEAGRWLHTVTILTRAATEHLAPIHDRMPVVVPAQLRGQWLAPGELSAGEAAGLLDCLPPALLEACAVGAGVGNVRNNHPGLLAPV